MKNINMNQIEMEQVSVKNRLISVIESLLFVSGEPLKAKEIANILECDVKFIRDLINEMKKIYKAEDRGIVVIEIDDSYALATKKENSEFIEKLLKTNVRQTLSQAALEALAIIAYKQPITRIDIDDIRGVKSDRAIQTLLEKKLIKECGRLDVPGRPILYGTTEEFLKHFGLENLNQMPSLEDILNNFGDKVNDSSE
ncbi:segregation and condensation protein B [Clostridium tetanomorphum]|uniref:Segregation and condensation protein B n=1 Tax=Clostridium tetanomorphum TaxID=1553 RepID=A0A923IYM8_CLOTT|nr:SMC-Scp complex subunit ScpB [Clostridium tetanomorphum]KAJ51458.1 segregation and condensation protein B [Clostridium tetanomorphum DSM 665]MBC2396551.1 segregation/condensation protein B [Clostridium tetanomorphum]NRS84956.1 segregation and condensation protein B [Clostridium tetanomorphum]NRZ98172.1 segregation and condensation protein B [Clostridium tetanomorphum]SQB91525.1 segregation and condensation protein B [Clostridium tetanomorphum]